MARKIFAWVLIVLSSIFLLASVVGIGAAWGYNEPLTREAVSRLTEIDGQLAQVQATLESSRLELERALRIVDTTEQALAKLAEKSNSAENVLSGIQDTLDKKLLPELKTTRERINSAREALANLQSVIEGVANFIPGIDLGAPKKIVTDLIDSANSIDGEIANAEDLANQASTFVGDTSYLLGGDFTQTRESLQNFITSIQEYQVRVGNWRTQVAHLIKNVPIWIDRASISITVFLLWFGLSQFGLLLHGLNLRRGGDPLEVLRRRQIVEEIVVVDIDEEG